MTLREERPAQPLWVLRRGGKIAEAEIVPCPLRLWLRVWHGGDEPVFGMIRPAGERAALMVEADEQRRGYQRQGYVGATGTLTGGDC